MKAVENDGLALEYTPETLRNDKEVVLKAVENAGFAF